MTERRPPIFLPPRLLLVVLPIIIESAAAAEGLGLGLTDDDGETLAEGETLGEALELGLTDALGLTLAEGETEGLATEQYSLKLKSPGPPVAQAPPIMPRCACAPGWTSSVVESVKRFEESPPENSTETK